MDPHQDPTSTQRFSHYPAIPPPVRLSLTTLPEHRCAYLPGRWTQTRAFWSVSLGEGIYRQLMDAGFRRSGRVLYQPVCDGCRACTPLRVIVREFKPSKSQRRCMTRNRDLSLRVGRPTLSAEKLALYARYQVERHGDAVPPSRADLHRFLYDSPLRTLEFCYRDASSRLLAVGICDVDGNSLSSVYFYYDPDEARRGLGTFGALEELAFAQAEGIDYYYLGYWVEGCSAMQYKRSFRPHELLGTDGRWRREC